MQDVVGVFTAFLVAAVPLALMVTKGVDLVRNLFDPFNARTAKIPWVWNVLAFGMGVGLALGWQYNLVSALSHTIPALTNASTFDGVSGQVLTGLALGAMAGFWHEKLNQWSSAARASRAAAASYGDVRTSNTR